MNDGEENILDSALFIRDKLSAEMHVQLLPYHAMGKSKLESLENTNAQQHIVTPSDVYMKMIKDKMEKYGLRNVQVGSAM